MQVGRLSGWSCEPISSAAESRESAIESVGDSAQALNTPIENRESDSKDEKSNASDHGTLVGW